MTDTSATPPPWRAVPSAPDGLPPVQGDALPETIADQHGVNRSMPDTDWLTGLSSRLAFAHQVTQADRDRDQFSIAVIAVENFAEVNRQLGYHVGDDLLRAIGHALSMQTSVNTLAARLDGTQFGLLGLHISDGDVQQWLGPIVSAARSAMDLWAADQIDFTGDCPIEPDLLVGTASGFSGEVWVNAASAVDVAGADPNGQQVMNFTLDDPRFVAIERRKQLTDRIAASLGADELSLAADRIELVGGSDSDIKWLRLAAFVEPTEDTALGGVIDSAILPPGLGRRLERWLIERAGRLIRTTNGPVRLTVPMSSEAQAGRAFAERIFPLMEQNRISPSRLLFEVSASTLTEAGTRGWEFARQVDSVGAGLVLTDCEGGWPTWRAMEGLQIAYLRPEPELVKQASNGSQAARRILSAVALNAEDADRELIAPSLGIAGGILADLGFTFAERPYQPTATDESR